MLVSVGDLIWGAIGLATLALLITLVAVAWQLRETLRVAGLLAVQVERDLSPTLQDLQHIMDRLDKASAVVGEKADEAVHLLDRFEESLAAGRVRAHDAWDDTRVWLESLRVGWQAGLQVIREGGNNHHVEREPEIAGGFPAVSQIES